MKAVSVGHDCLETTTKHGPDDLHHTGENSGVLGLVHGGKGYGFGKPQGLCGQQTMGPLIETV